METRASTCVNSNVEHRSYYTYKERGKYDLWLKNKKLIKSDPEKGQSWIWKVKV